MSIDSVISITVPPAFTLVQVDSTWDVSDGAITVTISGGTPEYTYILTQQSTIIDTTVSSTSVTLNNLDGGDWNITVIDANNCGPLQSQVIGLDISDFSMGSDLKLYPNPSTGEFTIEFANSDADDVMLEIINMTGQLVYKKLHKFNGNPRFIETIDFGNQARGPYLLRVNGLPVKAKLMIE
ncbi:MAG: hypothetical protein AMS26_24170 [Bacteroides sp. SM23_62]|nr:MAG: hypothetical protein AMS26_24170 [Bacteroides sp. SM23_62]